MAATILQIRRGSGSVSLADGEIYLHKGSGSLQVGVGTTPITLARLDQPNSGSLRLGGNITASNAYFSGDVTISGSISVDVVISGSKFNIDFNI
jgi:hypothetical protein